MLLVSFSSETLWLVFVPRETLYKSHHPDSITQTQTLATLNNNDLDLIWADA